MTYRLDIKIYPYHWFSSARNWQIILL